MSILRRITAVGVLSLLALAFVGVPARAHNIITWTGSGCLLTLHDNLIGGLDSVVGTCNAPSDNFWRGTVKDDHATIDGHCVTAILDGIIMAVSCNAGGTTFTFQDPQGNRNAPTFICHHDNFGFCTGADNFNF